MARLVLVRRQAASQRGSALIAVIFTLLIVAAITGSLLTATRTDLTLSQTLELETENEFLAEGGIAVAILDFSDPESKTLFIPDGRSYEMNLEGKRLSVRVESEAGKINLNQSPNPLLKRLLAVCGGETQTEPLANAIDGHNAPKDGSAKAFLTVDELKRLPGAGAALVAAIEPYVSVYNFKAEPDFELAPEKLKTLMNEGHGPTPSERGVAASSRPSNRSGIFTVTASILEEAGASIRAIIYLTGDKREPYYVFDWRRVRSQDSSVCGEALAQ
jgi:general secretion pathway protein K